MCLRGCEDAAVTHALAIVGNFPRRRQTEWGLLGICGGAAPARDWARRVALDVVAMRVGTAGGLSVCVWWQTDWHLGMRWQSERDLGGSAIGIWV